MPAGRSLVSRANATPEPDADGPVSLTRPSRSGPRSGPRRHLSVLGTRDHFRVDGRRSLRPRPRRHSLSSLLDEGAARRLCSLVAGVLCADDQLKAVEREFLKRLMRWLDLETDTALMPIYVDDVEVELRKLPGRIQRKALDLAIAAAAVDGEIVCAERAIVDAIANQLCVSAEDVETRLARALRSS